MAESQYIEQKLKYNTLAVSWTNVPNANTCQVYALDDMAAEISVHVTGSFGGATIQMLGGNVSSNVTALLQQINGDDASVTSEDLFSILDRPLYIKPVIVGGSGSSISVYMAVKYIFN